MAVIKSSIAEFSVAKDPDFQAICNSVFPEIFKRLNISTLTEFDQLDSSQIDGIDLDIRYQMNLMADVDWHLRRLILKLYGPVLFLQFPPNIRISSADISEDHFNRPYVTDLIHCDSWSQAPPDSYNLFLYLQFQPGRPCLDFYEVDDFDFELLRSYKGPYCKAPKLHFKRLPTTAETGKLYIFPTHTPHKTNRGEYGLRISLDARFRPLNNNFLSSDLYNDLVNDNWEINRMTSLGVYWIFSDQPTSSFEHKVKQEFHLAESFDPLYLQKRRKYTSKFYDLSNLP